MLKKIKNNNIKNLNQSLQKNPVQRKGFNGQVRNVGFIVDNDKLEDFDEIKQLRNELAEIFNIKQDDVWGVEWIEKVKHTEDHDDWFTVADFNWRGRLNYNNLNKFVNSDFDLLINLQNSSNLFLSNVNLLSKARLKAGLKCAEIQGLDFELAGNSQNKSLLFDELKKYILRFN